MFLTFAQTVDAEALAKADAQAVLAYVVAALVVTVIFLFGLLIKLVKTHIKLVKTHVDELKARDVAEEARREAFALKYETLQERLLKLATSTNAMLEHALNDKKE